MTGFETVCIVLILLIVALVLGVIHRVYASCYIPEKRTWVGLTDEEMHECWDSPLTQLGMKHARMIEAKLKEKNGL